METMTLTTQPRETGGKGPARRTRREGRTPAVVYGHQVEASLSVSLDPRELRTALANPKGANQLFDVSIGDATHKCFVREIQRHPVRREILHVDLVATDTAKPIISDIPVNIVGRSIGVQTGGKLRVPYREIKVSSLPAIIPACIELDVTEMDHDHTVRASDLELPDGVETIYEQDFVVVKIVPPRGRREDEAEVESVEKAEE